MTRSKRFLDLTILALAAPLLLPVLGVLIALSWAFQGRPVFFAAERMRDPTHSFTLWKLRSMRHDPADQGVSGGDKSARITPFGRLLRATRLDELPQMLNILTGEISFVGPRPPLREYVERFPELYAAVLQARPGITGLATLVFARHEEKLLARCTTAAETDALYARACIPRKARIDLIYGRNASVGLDLWLVLLTATRTIGIARGGTRLPRLRRKPAR